MSDVLHFRPVEIATVDLDGLSDVDLVAWGGLVERAAAEMGTHGDRHAAELLMEISGALRREYDRRLAGQPPSGVVATLLGDAGVTIDRAEANRLMLIFDGLAGTGGDIGALADAAFLLGLAAAVERQLAHNLAAEGRVLGMLDA
jgi:hypothetical protein